MLLEERTGLPSLKSCNRVKLRTEVEANNEVVMKFETDNIMELNSLMYTAANVIIERMGREKKGPKNHSGRRGLNKALRHGDETSARSKKSEAGT